jgi:hypothetical protein
MEIVRVDTKCQVKQANSSKLVEAEVHEFKEKNRLVVVLNKSVKLNMIWNGKVYEAKMAGIDFVSDGPKVTKNTTGR